MKYFVFMAPPEDWTDPAPETIVNEVKATYQNIGKPEPKIYSEEGILGTAIWTYDPEAEAVLERVTRKVVGDKFTAVQNWISMKMSVHGKLLG